MKPASHRIARTFARLRRERRKALIAYLAAGWPSLREEETLIPGIVRSGVDILELGVPFSDPIADGPTIQFASQKALESGVTLEKIFGLVRRLRRTLEVPILLMTYMNPVLRRGTARFCREARRAGADGLIVPDLIPEESGPVRSAARREGLRLVGFVSPTSGAARQRRVARESDGFIYAVSVTGVTGARGRFPPETRRMLSGLRKITPKPVALGFGVSRPGPLRALLPSVDGVIVGSALIEAIRRARPGRRLAAARRLLGPLRKVLDGRALNRRNHAD